MRSLRLLFSWFRAISSSFSSEVLSGRAITRIEAWTPECLSVSSSAFEMCTIWAPQSPLLQSEICLSPHWEMSVKRQSLALVLLLPQAKPVEVVVQQVEDLSEPRIHVWRCLCRPIRSHQLLLPDPPLERFWTKDRSQVLSEWLAIAYPHLQRLWTLANSWESKRWPGWVSEQRAFYLQKRPRRKSWLI